MHSRRHSQKPEEGTAQGLPRDPVEQNQKISTCESERERRIDQRKERELEESRELVLPKRFLLLCLSFSALSFRDFRPISALAEEPVAPVLSTGRRRFWCLWCSGSTKYQVTSSIELLVQFATGVKYRAILVSVDIFCFCFELFDFDNFFFLVFC